jgi:hypothetical protein
MKTKFTTSPFLILISTVIIVAAIFLLNDTLSLVMVYVIGIIGSLGLVAFFTFHRWNKKKGHYKYKTDVNSHNE